MDTNKKILIIDDFATMRKLLISMLLKLGFKQVTDVESATEAWKLLQKDEFDLIISDYHMPEMNGVELLAKVRQDAVLEKLPFILLTAEDNHALLVESKKHRVSAYILKPYKLDVIEEKLKAVFA